MSDGRKLALALTVMYVLAIGTVVVLIRPWSTGGDTTDDAVPTTVTQPAGPPPVGPPTEYRVQLGDTLTGIAERFDATTQAIIDENRLTDPDHLTEGQLLLIPQPPPVWLEIAPPVASLGESVELILTGARPSETVTFEIQSPNGVHVGPPHTASADGTVSTTFRTNIADEPGTYTVVASGRQGTTAQAVLHVEREDV